MKARRIAIAALLISGCGSADSADGPKVVREGIEWLDVWVPNADVQNLPRVLLLGDSIARGYGSQVEQKLKGQAYVARMATSKSVGDPALLAEVAMILNQAHFDVIHFNNGLHGFGYTEADYARAFPDLIATIKRGAPGAKLIWATTTPIRLREQPKEVDPWTRRVESRNAIAARIVEAERIPVDDLFDLMIDHPEYHELDGIHFNGKGIAAQAAQVAERIKAVLDEPKRSTSAKGSVDAIPRRNGSDSRGGTATRSQTADGPPGSIAS